jgi:hypothetical protein
VHHVAGKNRLRENRIRGAVGQNEGSRKGGARRTDLNMRSVDVIRKGIALHLAQLDSSVVILMGERQRGRGWTVSNKKDSRKKNRKREREGESRQTDMVRR